jgi:hypothetical protein
MEDLLGQAIALLVAGVVFWLISGNILALFIVAAVIWACASFWGGFTGGGKR